jgi:hypothetical protein
MRLGNNILGDASNVRPDNFDGQFRKNHIATLGVFTKSMEIALGENTKSGGMSNIERRISNVQVI